MVAPSLGPALGPVGCPACGAPLPPAAQSCPRCAAPLTLDVHVEAPPRDVRARLAAATAIGELGPPAPSFLEAKARLAQPGPLGTDLPAWTAAALLQVGQAHGARLSVRPHATARGPSPWPARLWIAAAVAVLVGVGWSLTRSPPRPVAPRKPPQSVAVPSPRPEPAGGRGAGGMTLVKIERRGLDAPGAAERVQAASATLRCAEATGFGFFVATNRLLAPATVLCPAGQPLTVRLADGRVLPATVESSLPRLGVVAVRVPEAVVTPLLAGDSSALEAGTAIGYLPEPILAQLAFTSLRDRGAELGVPMLELQADAAPRPGSALVDVEGRVLGMAVDLPWALSRGSLGVPIEALVPPSGPGAARWNRAVSQVQAADLGARESFTRLLDQPYLLGTAATPTGTLLGLVLMQEPGLPGRSATDFQWYVGGDRRCSVRGEFQLWTPLAAASERVQRQARAAWLLSAGAADGLVASEGELEPLDCTPEDLAAAGRLVLPAGSSYQGRADVGAGLLADAARATSRSAATRSAQIDQAREHQQRQVQEQVWRTRFANLNARLRHYQQIVDEGRQEIARREKWVVGKDEAPMSVAELEVLKARVGDAEAELRRLAEEQHELERAAALDAVPLEWRK